MKPSSLAGARECELSSSSEALPPKKNYGQTITLNRSLLLLPTLGPNLGATLDISIALCLALLIRFFEELDVLIVTVMTRAAPLVLPSPPLQSMRRGSARNLDRTWDGTLADRLTRTSTLAPPRRTVR